MTTIGYRDDGDNTIGDESFLMIREVSGAPTKKANKPTKTNKSQQLEHGYKEALAMMLCSVANEHEKANPI